MKKTADWIIEEYRKGNMVDYDGNKIETVEIITPSVRRDILEQYENGDIYSVSDY